MAGYDYEANKPVNIALSLNSDFASTEAKDIAAWVRDELVHNGFDPNNVNFLVSDNSNDVTDVARELGAIHIGCLAHLANLVVEDAWDAMTPSWIMIVKNIITMSKTNYGFAANLRALQGPGLAKILLKWNDLRWLGKFLALERFYDIFSRSDARKLIIDTPFSDDNMNVIALILPLLGKLAKITTLISGEKVVETTKSVSTVHYGTHLYPIMWYSFSFLFATAESNWDSISQSPDYIGTWKFVVLVLEGLFERFFKDTPAIMRASFALSAGPVLNNDIKSFFTDYKCFFEIRRSVPLPPHGSSPSPHLSLSEYLSILRLPNLKWVPNTPVTRETMISHLKYSASKFQLAWNDLIEPNSKLVALRECYHSAPTNLPPQIDNMQTIRPNVSRFSFGHLDSPEAYAEMQRRASAATQTLEFEFEAFAKQAKTSTESALAWASTETASTLPKIRALIVRLHSLPLGSIAAEQLFSVMNFHVDEHNSLLNQWDLETRVTVAFNCRLLDQDTRAQVLGWSPYLHVLKAHENVISNLETANDMPIGASHRRTGERGREAKLAKRLSTGTSEATSSATPTRSTTPPVTNPKKRGRPKKSVAPVDDDSDDDALLTLTHTSKTAAPPGNAPPSEPNSYRSVISNSLTDAATNFGANTHALRISFQTTIKNWLGSRSPASSLVELGNSVTDVNFSKFLKSFATNLREGVSLDECLVLLRVEFTRAPSPHESSTMDIDDNQPLLYRGAEDASIYTSIARQIRDQIGPPPIVPPYTEPVVAAAILESWNEWVTHHEDFAAEVAEIEVVARKRGVQLRNVPSDGNCLYHCIALAQNHPDIGNNPLANSRSSRKSVGQYLQKQLKTWFPFLAAKETKTSFCLSQSKEGTWGDCNVVKAAAELYNWNINVYVAGVDDITIFAPLKNINSSPVVHLFQVKLRHFMIAFPTSHL